MKISIQTLVDGQVMSFNDKEILSFTDFPSIACGHDYLAHVKGTIKKDGSNYFVTGEVKVKLSLLCDRCLESFDYVIQADLWEQFTTDETLNLEDEEIKLVTKSIIDLSDTIKETVIMHLPMKVLCDDDCKGICNTCGINLNHETCTCKVTDIDPRLEKLKGFFEN
jgi:uncharacterized protein